MKKIRRPQSDSRTKISDYKRPDWSNFFVIVKVSLIIGSFNVIFRDFANRDDDYEINSSRALLVIRSVRERQEVLLNTAILYSGLSDGEIRGGAEVRRSGGGPETAGNGSLRIP